MATFYSCLTNKKVKRINGLQTLCYSLLVGYAAVACVANTSNLLPSKLLYCSTNTSFYHANFFVTTEGCD